MQHIDFDNSATTATERAFATPESTRTATGQTPEALAFQIAVAALDSWTPDLAAPDAFSLRMIAKGAEDTAQSIYLNSLAGW